MNKPTTSKQLLKKAYLNIVSMLCDGDNCAPIHRRGITTRELEERYQELFVGPVAHD